MTEQIRKDNINRKKSVLIIVGALFVLLALIVAFRSFSRSQVKEISFFMENGRGTYDLVEMSLPGESGPHPVVLMAHGFAGSLHSGGAVELGQKLAEKGMIAVRVDFDPYAEPKEDAERVHSYPLRNMREDAVLAIKKSVSEYNGDPDRVSLYGRSYGGRLVMTMANESDGGFDYERLALIAPAGDAVAFERYLGGKKKYSSMKKEAAEKGFAVKLGVKIEPEWFEDVEAYDPTKFGYKFGRKPVLLYYNTKDTVVYPDTSIRCAEAYENHEIIEVTTDDSHGYEMGFEKSELKDEIMDRVTRFLTE